MQEKIKQEKERAGKAVQDKLLKLSGTDGRRSHRRSRSRSRSRDRRRSRSRGRSPDSSSSKRKRKYEDFHPHLRWTKKYDRPLPQVPLRRMRRGWVMEQEDEEMLGDGAGG